MNNDEMKNCLVLLDYEYFGDFDDQDWDSWFGAAKDGWMEKFAGLWVESQQALGEIVGLLQHQLDNEEPDDLITILQLLEALMQIARTARKGGK